MTFRDWQELSPEAAAREVHERARTRLPPAQQRAAIALLRSEAELAEELARAKSAGTRALAGVPFFAKDLFSAAGTPLFAGSTFLPELRPPPEADGYAVAALRRAGAVFAGKTHLHEFAYGVTGENPHYGDCEHPRFPGRTTGGSSSGSAAVVAAGVAPLALGTDTGGSVRVPAAFCGLFGFRLTPGDAWIRDAFPLATSFDTAGWFTGTAEDMSRAHEALVAPPAAPPPAEPRGVYLEYADVDAEVATACREAAQRFAPEADSSVAATLRAGFGRALEAYHTTVAAEAWRAHEPWADRYRDRYDPVVWQRLIRGRGMNPAQFDAASRDREAIRHVWAEFFQRFDFLVLPASPTPALLQAECTLENRNRIIALTAPASIGGLPVLTIPVPLPGGLTTGLQIVVNDPQSAVVRWALHRCAA